MPLKKRGKAPAGKKYRLRNYNFKLVLYAVVLSILGIFMVRSASAGETQTSIFSVVQKQMLAVAMGITIMVVVSFIDYHILLKLVFVLYIINIGLLVYVRFINSYTIMGAKRWIYIRGFGTIQPSEFSKIALAVMGAWFLGRMRDHVSHPGIILAYFAVTGITVVLIVIEPNLSTTIEVVWGIVIMLFLAEINWKWVTGALAAVALFTGLLLFLVYQPEQKILNTLADKNIIQPYWITRIDAFFFPEQYPDTTYQQLWSVLAIGSGQLTGKGLNTSSLESVKNGGFLSEEQSDFIFAVLGEELGFAGCMFLILLYVLITIEGLRISARSPDMEGKIMAGGLISIFSFQALVNMGVATMVLPNTGTPLPFISAGMSSLLGSYLMIGILLNIGLQKKRTFMEVSI